MLPASKKFFTEGTNLIKQLTHYVKNIYHKRRNKCLVLLYHRVCKLENDPQLLSVSPKRFEEQIKYLKERFQIIPLQELVFCLKKGKVPDNSVVITFDDGYADILHNAKPILEKYNAPATVFVATALIGSRREFWWDDMERILLNREYGEYKNLELTIRGKRYQWEMGRGAEANKKVYEEMYSLLRRVPDSERQDRIAYLSKWAGMSAEGRPTHRVLTEMELRELAKGELIEVGAHTMSHTCLALESDQDQKYELEQSKAKLEKLLCTEINSLSYPFGGSEDITENTIKIARQCGYSCGLSNIRNNTYSNTYPYLIPRRLVRNWDLNEFQKIIDSFLSYKDIFDVTVRLFDHFTNYYRFSSEAKKEILSINFRPELSGTKNKKREMENVLQINKFDCRGGAAKVAYRIHTRLRDLGYQSRMLVSRSFCDDDDVDVLLRENSERHSSLLNWQKRRGWNDMLYLESLRIQKCESFEKTDVLHLHNLHGAYFSPLALPQLSALKPTVWTLHDMQAITGYCAHSLDCEKWMNGCGECPYFKSFKKLEKDSTAFLWEIKKNIYERSRLTIICPAEWLRKKISNSILKSQDIRLIYNGIDTQVFKPIDKGEARAKLGLPHNKNILVCSASGGINTSWKGAEFVVKAYKELRGSGDLLFLNLGGTSSIPRSRNWMDVGYIDEESAVALYYSAADLVIYPSTADTCPLVVLESLSCGTPVISFKTGGIPEIVRHLSSGYLAEYGNEDDFIRGIILFIQDSELRNAASGEARASVKKRFSLEHMVNQYLNVYEEIYQNS